MSEKKPDKKKKIVKKKKAITTETQLPKEDSEHIFVRKGLGVESHVLADPEMPLDTVTPTQKRIEKQLEELYKNEKGELPDFNNFEKRKHSSLVRAFFTLLLTASTLLAVLWAGLFFFPRNNSFQKENVTISFSGDNAVTLGQEVHYRLRYRNEENVPLSQAVMRIRYPAGFVFESASRESTVDTRDEWSLGTLPPGESGYIDITGRFFANLGTEESFRLFLDYLPANFSSSFQTVATFAVKIDESPYELTVDGPKDVTLGTEVPLTIRIKTKETINLKAVALQIEPGNTFTKNKSKPETDEFNQFLWTLKGEEKESTVEIFGSFTPENGVEEVSLPVRIVGWQDESRQGEGVVLQETIFHAQVVKTDISLQRVVNGATERLLIQPGESLNSSIVLRNNGEESLKNVRIRAVFVAPAAKDKSILAWDKLSDENNGKVVGEKINDDLRRGSIVWDATSIRALREIGPGKDVTIDFQLPLKDGEGIDLSGFATSTLDFTVDVQYESHDKTDTLSSSALTMTINSDLRLDIRQSQEKQGDNDAYEITWVLTNSFHDLENVSVVADIYGDVHFDESRLVVPAGKANFDEKEKRLTWQIDKMPTSVDVLPLQFLIVQNKDNPSQTELVSKVQLRAKDTVTGQDIVIVGGEIKLETLN